MNVVHKETATPAGAGGGGLASEGGHQIVDGVSLATDGALGVTWTTYSTKMRATLTSNLISLQSMYPNLHLVILPPYEGDVIDWLLRTCTNLRIPVVSKESAHPATWLVFIATVGDDEPLLPSYASDIIRHQVEPTKARSNLEPTLDATHYPSLYRQSDDRWAPARNYSPPSRPKGAPPMPPRSWNWAPFV